MKKRIWAVIISIVIALPLLTSGVVLAEDNITVKLNGQILTFDVQPQLINGRTMVPLRKIFESLGATVEWDEETQTVTSVRGDTTVKLTIGVPAITINKQIPKELDTAPCTVNDRTLVPVRAVSEAFNMNVDWDDAAQTVLITSPNVNMTAYNKLKNIILTEGDKSSITESYSIYYIPRDEKYSLMLDYQPKYENITLYYTWEGSLKNTVMISVYTDMNPSLYYVTEYSSGSEYVLYADYPKANQPFVEKNNTFPDYLPPYESLNLNMALMDILMQDVSGMSFSDFGLYYVKPQ